MLWFPIIENTFMSWVSTTVADGIGRISCQGICNHHDYNAVRCISEMPKRNGNNLSQYAFLMSQWTKPLWATLLQVMVLKPDSTKPLSEPMLTDHQRGLLPWRQFHMKWSTLQWRHNKCYGVSNHRCIGCLLNRLFRRRTKKTSKVRATGLCEGNSPVTGEFPAQRASKMETASIWWRRH